MGTILLNAALTKDTSFKRAQKNKIDTNLFHNGKMSRFIIKVANSELADQLKAAVDKAVA